MERESGSVSRGILKSCARLWISLWAIENGRIDATSHEQISARKKFVFTSGLMWKEGFSVAEKTPADAPASGSA